MIYLEYLLAASIVVILSIKASKYVDLLDKNTMLSGAFLGGILLSAVTSLPEFFTSISATIMLDRPGMCMGNILGLSLIHIFRNRKNDRIRILLRLCGHFVLLCACFF